MDLVNLIALAASWSSGCKYCQAHTSHGANRAGVSPEKSAEILKYKESSQFSESEKAALDLAFAAGVTPNASKKDHFVELQKYYSDEAIIDIVAVIALFGFLNRWNDTLGTALEDVPKGFVEDKTPEPVVSIEKDSDSKLSQSKVTVKTSNKLDIQSFNDITDKMCRGIAKKAYTAGKRNELDTIALLDSVGQALSDYGKLNDDIQGALDILSKSNESSSSESIEADFSDKEKVSSEDNSPKEVLKSTLEIDIKDLNEIEDKMVRGIAKKAFVAAKRTGDDKVASIKSAIDNAGKMSDSVKVFLDKFSNDNIGQDDVGTDDLNAEKAEVSLVVDIDIKDLNGIEDKMVRGIAKKAFVAAKRTGEDKLNAIKKAIQEAGKLDESIEAVLNKLGGG